MAAEAHLLELKNKHARIDGKIKRELKNPIPDSIRLSKLKRQKLQLKDQIVSAKTA